MTFIPWHKTLRRRETETEKAIVILIPYWKKVNKYIPYLD